MKFLLMIHVDPAASDALSEEERKAGYDAHDAFIALTENSGELVGFAALADPASSATVRVRDGIPAVTSGPYVAAEEFLAGFCVVDCETVERAAELAALIPDARYAAVEVWPVMDSGGTEM